MRRVLIFSNTHEVLLGGEDRERERMSRVRRKKNRSDRTVAGGTIRRLEARNEALREIFMVKRNARERARRMCEARRVALERERREGEETRRRATVPSVSTTTQQERTKRHEANARKRNVLLRNLGLVPPVTSSEKKKKKKATMVIKMTRTQRLVAKRNERKRQEEARLAEKRERVEKTKRKNKERLNKMYREREVERNHERERQRREERVAEERRARNAERRRKREDERKERQRLERLTKQKHERDVERCRKDREKAQIDAEFDKWLSERRKRVEIAKLSLAYNVDEMLQNPDVACGIVTASESRRDGETDALATDLTEERLEAEQLAKEIGIDVEPHPPVASSSSSSSPTTHLSFDRRTKNENAVEIVCDQEDEETGFLNEGGALTLLDEDAEGDALLDLYAG